MIKMIYCLRRLPHISLEEFQAHWLEHNAQYARRSQAIRRYVQYHRLINDPVEEAMSQTRASSVESYDGAAVMWWDDLRALQEDMTESPHIAAALEDEKLFVDHSRSLAFLTQEQVIVEPQGAVPYVLIECLRRRSDIDRGVFQNSWLHHGDIGRRATDLGLAGYIQNHTLLDDPLAGLESLLNLGTGKEAWDGVTTAYFQSVVKFKLLVTSPLAAQESFKDEKKFIDHGQSVNMVTRRHVIKDLIR